MNSDLKKFLVFGMKALVVLFLLDFGLGQAITFFYDKMRTGERARAHYAIRESSADVYVFGSSRAAYHYHPGVLQDSLKLTAYNAGRSAQSLLYHLPLMKMIVKRHVPKLIILDINEREFTFAEKKYDMISALLPYYREDEGVRAVIDHVNPHYKYFSWLRCLPYNSSVVAILIRSLTSRGERKDLSGYLSLSGHRGISEHLPCNDSTVLDPLIVKSLREFVQVCKDSKVRLVMVTSPRFEVTPCRDRDFEALVAEISRMGIDYVDMSRDKKYLGNITLMFDEAHLNLEGSLAFTAEIAHHILQTH